MSIKIIQAGPATIEASFWRDRPLTYPVFSEAAAVSARLDAKKKPKPRPKPGGGY